MEDEEKIRENMTDLYNNVVQNKYGFYERKGLAKKDRIAAFYANCYYQNDMANYKKEYTAGEKEEKIRQLRMMEYILEHCVSRTNRGGDFLDIGCGEGFALKYFMQQGYEVSGIEFSLAGCRYHNPEVAEKIVEGDAESILEQYGSKQYSGTILMDHVLEHVVHPEKLIQKVTAVTKGGSCLIISVPNDFSKTQMKLFEKGHIDGDFWVSKNDPPEHLSYFNKKALQSLLEENGWKMEFITGSFPIDFNLFNENTNYTRNKKTGKSCHEAAMEIEELLLDAMGMREMVEMYKKLGEAGLGRNITAYFILP